MLVSLLFCDGLWSIVAGLSPILTALADWLTIS
jgi:hypothetical protein